MADPFGVTLPAQTRLMFPQATNPDLQSLYIFNMYRAGSSVTEAVGETLGAASRHTSFNPVNALSAAGVGLIDHQDHRRASVHVEPRALDVLGNFGGYILSGFREIPQEFGDAFAFPGAAVIVVRDPRDILYSQYNAVKKHAVSGAHAHDIMALRETTSQQSIEEFMLSDDSLAFIRRICRCYWPLIHKGVPVIQYETFVRDSGFDAEGLMFTIAGHFGPLIAFTVSRERAVDNLKQRIANSKSLRGHQTGARTRMYRDLPGGLQQTLADALSPELAMFGYDTDTA